MSRILAAGCAPLVVNSGNANCATGPAGWRAALATCARVGRLLGCRLTEVLPASTGVIGVPLPVDRVLKAVPALARCRSSSSAALKRFARAILTTDTRPKLASAELRLGRRRLRLVGVAKGAGMIQPRLATMLVFLFTDAVATPAELRRALRRAARASFERISVDGDTSTNDTVLLAASGASGLRLSGRTAAWFAAALTAVCESLALQIVRGGEGARKLVTLRVEGAPNRAAAERVAHQIANSPLVKTALAGADPNWGRVLAAAGASGVRFDPGRVDIWLGRHLVCRRGRAVPFDEHAAHRYLRGRDIEIRVGLGAGRSAAHFWTCEFTSDYVRINASYRS